MIKYYIKRIKLKLKIFNNKIYVLLNKNKFKKKIAIVSCDKYKNRIEEDILLKIGFNKHNIDCNIISYETDDYLNYDALIIRSIWGYQDNIEEFNKFLNKVKKNNIKIFNSVDIINNNYHKNIQYELLVKNNIPVIKTYFTKDLDEASDLISKEKEPVVIKPIVSGSGHNTYVIGKTSKNSIKVNDIKNKFKDIDSGVMIQPYVKEVENGELSLIFINNKFLYGIKRYTNIFNDKFEINYIDKTKVDSKLIDMGFSILKIKEYENSTYARIDLIKTNSTYKIMEVELVEPQLFLTYIPNCKYQNYCINELIKSIIDKI